MSPIDGLEFFYPHIVYTIGFVFITSISLLFNFISGRIFGFTFTTIFFFSIYFYIFYVFNSLTLGALFYFTWTYVITLAAIAGYLLSLYLNSKWKNTSTNVAPSSGENIAQAGGRLLRRFLNRK